MSQDKVSALDAVSDTYHYGFETKIDAETAPKGLNEDIIRFISAKKRTGMAAGFSVKGLPSLADDERTDLGKGILSPD